MRRNVSSPLRPRLIASRIGKVRRPEPGWQDNRLHSRRRSKKIEYAVHNLAIIPAAGGEAKILTQNLDRNMVQPHGRPMAIGLLRARGDARKRSCAFQQMAALPKQSSVAGAASPRTCGQERQRHRARQHSGAAVRNLRRPEGGPELPEKQNDASLRRSSLVAVTELIQEQRRPKFTDFSLGQRALLEKPPALCAPWRTASRSSRPSSFRETTLRRQWLHRDHAEPARLDWPAKNTRWNLCRVGSVDVETI